MLPTTDIGARPEWKGKTVIVYDGDCPFCSNFVKFQRLRSAIGEVLLIDARSDPSLVVAFQSRGISLDDGMALLMDGQTYFGADTINRLALLSSESDWFNRMNALIFRSPTVSKVLYPFLRFGRNLTLRLLGRKKLAA